LGARETNLRNALDIIGARKFKRDRRDGDASVNSESNCAAIKPPQNRRPVTLGWIVLKSRMSAQISKKRKFVADGVFRAELNEFFTRELAEEGYSGCDVRVTHARTEVRSSFRVPQNLR
jgi:hypothetical protein